MTLYEFKLLEETEQADMLWEKGVYIANRKEDEKKILLYQIDGFYVEVWYDATDNRILKLRSFSSTGQLQPYLEKINISMDK